MKFRRNGTRKRGDSCVADAETGATNGPFTSQHTARSYHNRRPVHITTDGPFISQHPLNASFMKSSVNMGYELKGRRSILGNGRELIAAALYSRNHPDVVHAVICVITLLLSKQRSRVFLSAYHVCVS
jgi:hypothetical protein